MFENYEFRILRPDVPRHFQAIKDFLAVNGLEIEKLDYYVGAFSGDEMVAGGGAYKNIIKCVAVTSFARESNLAGPLVTRLHKHVRENGYPNTFLFTKRIYEKIFSSLAFYPVGASPDAVLLESLRGGIQSYAESLRQHAGQGPSAVIVMNCNPFTRGHLYLIETAASLSDRLHVFVLSEEQPFMPASDRFELVKKGTAHLPNVTVHLGSQYIISQATFPSYFIKDASSVARNQILLDLDIFSRHIAPALNVKKRFVGEEPTDMATKQYNELMKQTLPQKGVELVEIPRKLFGGKPISASLVRALYGESKFELIAPLVPEATMEYLLNKSKNESPQ